MNLDLAKAKKRIENGDSAIKILKESVIVKEPFTRFGQWLINIIPRIVKYIVLYTIFYKGIYPVIGFEATIIMIALLLVNK